MKFCKKYINLKSLFIEQMFDKLFYNDIITKRKIKMKTYLSFAILLDLIKHKFVTARYLSQKYEVSIRSVYRYLNELESAGISTYTKPGKNGGIGIEDNFLLNTISLQENERKYLKQQLEFIINLKKTDYDEQLCHQLIKKLNL